jgi:hypothetical protein
MTANQRRPGFRLPWSPDTEGAEGEETVATVAADESSQPAAPAAESRGPAEANATGESPSGQSATATPSTEQPAGEASAATNGASGAAAPSAEAGGEEFMRDLVAAMRGVADEAREAGVSELRTHADEEVHRLEADAERRQADLRERAEADVNGVAEWAAAETERIKTEAEQRVVARRAQLDQQLAADSTRTDGETKAVRDRVAEYERELDAYHAQLSDISDPAAFAAAAKRMPKAPSLTGAPAAPAAATVAAPEAPEAASTEPAPAEAASTPVPEAPSPEAGRAEPAEDPAPAEASGPPPDEALAARLAALDASASENGASAASAGNGEPVTTEVIVKGLGSFGAITGFRQSLSNVNGVDGVALSLGQTGEFVFRATHAAGFDIRAAIVALEGDGAKVEDRPEGGLRVTLERAR